jgi:O-antigen/teichoic acid export membrane protein
MSTKRNSGRVTTSPGRAAAGRAGAWSAVDLLGRQGVTFTVSIILARLLTPADFGAVAIAAFFSTFVIGAVQAALSTAIIQRHDCSDREVSSIFWLNLIATAILSALFAAAGPAVAVYFGIPVLGPLMLASAAQANLTALGSVHLALLTRDLRFRAIAISGIPATVVSGAIGVLLAFSGFGVWALAAQIISAAALGSLGAWLVCAWRPTAIMSVAELRDTWAFARWVSLSTGLEVLYTQGFALILGKLYGPRQLGLYSRASSVQNLPGTVVSGIIGRVALPLFARRRAEPEALRSGLLAANQMAMLVAMPALVGLALTSDSVMLVLYGSQWVGAAPVLAILAWAGILYPLHVNNLQLLLANGRSDIFFRVEIAKKIVGVVSVIAGSCFGIIGLAWSQLLFSIVAFLINVWPSGRYFGCGVRCQILDLTGIIVATAIMALCVTIFRAVIHLPPNLALASTIGIGAGSYALASWLLAVPAFKDLLSIIPIRPNRETQS